jgi:hypothetical protein
MRTQYLVSELVREYISCAKYMCNSLKNQFALEEEPLLVAYRGKRIPKKGVLEGGIKYDFHGGGCYFEFDGGRIDVDFGPSGRCDGFDLYRLLDFLQSSEIIASKYNELDEETIRSELEDLVREKVIVSPGWYPNPSLYYLTSEIEFNL